MDVLMYIARHIEILFFPILVIFYIAFFIMYANIFIRQAKRKRLISAIFKIFESENDNLNESLAIVFKNTKIDTDVKIGKVNNIYDILEYIYYKVITFGKDNKIFGINYTQQTIDKIINYLAQQKSEDPYVSLNSRYNYYFTSIHRALKENNSELGCTMLSQLAKDIEIIEGKSIEDDNRNKINFIITLIGVILTIIFGFISFIK